MMDIIEVFKVDLIFNDLESIGFKSKLPLLIDENNKVIFGNCLRDNYTDIVNCIKIKSNDVLNKCLYNVEKELLEYIEFQTNYKEKELLFEYKEESFISEENYKHLPEYDFVKHNIVKKKDEVIENEDLFSCIGELQDIN